MAYDFHGDPILMPVFKYWRDKCGGRLMPQRSDIDPLEISPRLWPNLQITELVDGGARFRYRLVGTAIVDAYGDKLTGKYYDEVFSGDRLRFIEDNLRLICRERRPVFVCNQYHSTRDMPRLCARIVMPLSDDGLNVSHFLMVMTFHFPGAAHQWSGQWFANDGDFDFQNSYLDALN